MLDGQSVALKILNPPAGSDEEEIKSFEERFLLEAKTLATLDHPNIVPLKHYYHAKTPPGHVSGPEARDEVSCMHARTHTHTHTHTHTCSR